MRIRYKVVLVRVWHNMMTELNGHEEVESIMGWLHGNVSSVVRDTHDHT